VLGQVRETTRTRADGAVTAQQLVLFATESENGHPPTAADLTLCVCVPSGPARLLGALIREGLDGRWHAILAVSYRWLVRAGYCEDNPADQLPRARKRKPG